MYNDLIRKNNMNNLFVDALQNNPIFQLSLSSKELFHSNFLAWLAEDKNTQALFKKILSTLKSATYRV